MADWFYSTTYWTLVILTEQAFLNRGHFRFILDQESQLESRQICIQAALRIWKLVEAYKRAFTLRRAQYGVAYATYCAVLVMLQQTDRDCEENTGCIHFFWGALLEYQRGCSFGLKRPMRLLKSLMRRLETVWRTSSVDEAEPNYHETSGKHVQSSCSCTKTYLYVLRDAAFQADLDLICPPESVFQTEMGSWDGPSLDTAFNGECMIDDSVFGIADDSIWGTYM